MLNLLEKTQKLSFAKFSLLLPKYKRFLYKDIKLSKSKIVGIYGSRGVGKTTILLQIAKELDYKQDEILYISCDHPIFTDISLFEFVETFYRYGGKCVIIDEIHESKNFEQELKSIYDFLDIQIYFSGSSAVKLTNPSFVRRYSMFKLPILSLREFIKLKLDIELDSFLLDDILNNHIEIANLIIEKLKTNKILKLYRDYLNYGVYPYYFSDEISYYQKITDSINTILHTDIAIIYNVPPAKIEILKKLLITICLSKPLELSMENLSREVGISKVTLYKYIDYLHRAELLRHIIYEAKRFKAMQKPDKLYLSNTNLFKALCNNSDAGTVRETFFTTLVSYRYSLYYVDRGDFLVDDRYIFEIGGKNKSFKQIKDIKNSFIAVDDIEIGFKNKIPLWLFGFLY